MSTLVSGSVSDIISRDTVIGDMSDSSPDDQRPPHGSAWITEAGLLPRRDFAGGVTGLFAGREVVFTFKTRVAIRVAVDALALAPGDEVLVPAYNCGSEIDPLRQAGLMIRLYPVNRDIEVDPDTVEAMIGPRTRAIYITHYFGFLQPHLAALRALCDQHGLRLLEDCSLSLLSGTAPAEGRAGDIAFFCFYKFFPVIEGGALVVNRPLPAAPILTRPAPADKVARALLRIGVEHALGQGTLARLRRQEVKAPAKPIASHAPMLPNMPADYYFAPELRGRRISTLTLRALHGQPVSEAIRRRRQNYHALTALLGEMTGMQLLKPDLPADACPLNLPILVAGRDDVVRQLQHRGIAAAPWWAGYNRHLNWTNASDAMMLKNNLLTLPVHHFLENKHLRHIADCLHTILADR